MTNTVGYIKNSSGDINAEIQASYRDVRKFDITLNPSDIVFLGISVTAGEPVAILIDYFSAEAGQINIFVQGKGDDVLYINPKSPSFLCRSFKHSGELVVYGGNGQFSGGFYFPNDYVMQPKIALPGVGPESFIIRTVNPLDSVKVYKNKYISTNNCTIDTFESVLVNNDVFSVSEPFKVRDDAGSLLFNLSLSNANGDDSYPYTAILQFDRTGHFISELSTNNFVNKGIDKNCYIVSLVTASNYNRSWSISTASLNWLQGKAVYHVGPHGDFTTFTAMLRALKGNTTEKTVLVDPGEYDIFEEMGGASMIAGISNPSSMNWDKVCDIVPPNTTIIGIGHVVLKWEPDADVIGSEAMAFLFSPLNVQGSCKIENIEIKCKNCRYGIHDETGDNADFYGATHEFERVKVVNSGSTYGHKWAYGAGHCKNMTVKFKDCYMASDSQQVFSTHDWPAGKDEASSYSFENCVFDHTTGTSGAQTIRLSTTDEVGRLDQVKLHNCYIDGTIGYASEWTGDNRFGQGYELTMIGCNPVNVTYESTINQSSIVGPHVYNVVNK